MTYIVDTHILIWFMNKSKRLKDQHYKILIDKNNKLVFSAMVLAEAKYLISKRRVNLDYDEVLEYVSEPENCILYSIDEEVIQEMPLWLNIHDALIVATGLVYKNVLGEEVRILTEDKEIINSGYLPVA